jgi:hypothetical protein
MKRFRRLPISVGCNRVDEHRFLVLIISLLLLFMTWPLPIIAPPFGIVSALSFSLVIVSGVYAMRCERKLLIFILLLGIPAITTRWIGVLLPGLMPNFLEYLFPIFFFTLFTVFLLRTVLTEERITGDTIAGALSIYLLLGLIWAYTYQFLGQADPGSFDFNREIRGNGGLTRMDYLYFSFVTLATLGYGDIVPITPMAQSFAYAEAVIGVIYIAVLISRLVGSLRK